MKNFINTLKTFFNFAKDRKLAKFFFYTVLLASSLLGAFVPYFFKPLIDAVPARDFSLLYTTLLTLIAFRGGSLVLNNLAFTLGDIVWVKAAVKARITVVKRIQDLDFAYHSSKSTGSLISAVKRGDGAFFSLYHTIYFRFVRVLVGFFVMLYFFTTLDPLIGVIAAFSFLLIFVVGLYVVGYNVRSRKNFVKEEDNISGIIVDNIINFETVKLFSKERWEIDRLKKTFEVWTKAFWVYIKSFRIFDLSVGGLIVLSIFAILYVSITKVVTQEFGVGDFALIIGFVSAFYPRLSELVWGIRDIAKNYTDIQRYFEILDKTIKIKDPVNPKTLEKIKGNVEFKKVTFSYKGGQKNAVRVIDLNIRQGQSIALVGRSGSGKTTLIKLLLRFYDLDSGEILIDGVNITELTKSHLRSFMGVVPQEPILFNNTIGYNIGYGKSNATKAEIVAAAKIGNLHEFIETLPKGYNTDVGERGIKLSGGQKQRLAISRMMLANPEIIIFDEATSQLDSENEVLIREAFWKVARDKTTIIIAHRLATAMSADKIVVLDKGKIVESGSHKALLAKKNSLYAHFWNLQISMD